MLTIFSRKHKYTDTEFIEEGYKKGDKLLQKILFEKCLKQFYKGTSNYGGIDKNDKDDLFQSSYIILWEQINMGQIFVRNQEVFVHGAKEEKPIPDLVGYFMRIVKNKYLELLRENGKRTDLFLSVVGDEGEMILVMDDDPNVVRDRIVHICVSKLPKRCKEILTQFYYKQMSLEEILEYRKESISYDGLKSGKSKCMKGLKEKITIEMRRVGLTF